MKVLVIGSSGFIGRAVTQELRAQHEVVTAHRYTTHGVRIDLTDPQSIATVLKSVRPDAIVNCVGIVENSELAANNTVMTRNLLEQVEASGLAIQRIIVLGAASEYGLVDKLPVNEDTLRRATSPYGVSKKEEVDLALWFKNERHLPVVVVRPFNPIGPGMPPRTLLPGLMRQIAAFRAGETDRIEVGRLDAKRDYFDISDVGRAIGLLLSKVPKHAVYNIGLGVGTTNRRLVETMLAESGLTNKPRLIESSDIPEPRLASRADISRIQKEFGWKPQRTLAEVLREVVKVNVLIVGAGEGAGPLAKGIARNKESAFNLVGFVDDDKTKQGKEIGGFPVLGTTEFIRDIVIGKKVEELFIVTPSERGKVIRDVIERTIGLKLEYKILSRSLAKLGQSSKEDYLKYMRKVEIEDTLGGEILESEQSDITELARKRVIMITGAAGSIGSELSRQIAEHSPYKVVLYDWWENGMFALRNQLLETHPESSFEFVIGDVKDRKRLNTVMERFQPHTVFHAAAYKHVPLMESNPSEAIKNNIMGTKTVAEIAIKNGVKKFILVSTDKAVNPTNIMGASKRAAEKVIHILSASQSTTTFCAVRFGNVINSNGSAIPIFQKQISLGGPVRVTHKDITRFFMTIPEAVHLILQSWVMGENNDLFVLDMGEPVKIYDLARVLIALEGYEPDVDIKIDIVGLRPGEKLYEEVLVNEEEAQATSVKKIFRTQNYMSFDKLAFLSNLAMLIESLEDDNLKLSMLKQRMQRLISTYKPVD